MSTLRRTLGETRTKERAAREEAEAARGRAEETAARLERELRQLRAQVAKLEEQAGDQRRQARTDRDEVTVRARLLLETINDAAVGLRRELGLPSVSGNPGDRVEAALADEGTREPTLDRLDGAEQPGAARAVPRAAQGPPDRRRLQRHQDDLADARASRRSAPGCSPCSRRWWRAPSAEATVVFDAAASETRPVVGLTAWGQGALQPRRRHRRRRHPRAGRGRAGRAGGRGRHRGPRARRRRTPGGARVVAPGALTRSP